MMVGIKVRRTWSAVGVLILAILMISATEASACFVVGVASPTTTTAVTAAFDGDAHLRDSNQVHGPNASAGMRRQGRERPGGFRDLRAASRSGVAAKTATPLAKAGSAVVHGNSRLSPKTTYLYRLSDDEGNYLKTGVTSNPGSRYSQKFLVDKRLDFLTSGSRSNMLNLERFIVERDPGPLNFERWAGNFAGDVP